MVYIRIQASCTSSVCSLRFRPHVLVAQGLTHVLVAQGLIYTRTYNYVHNYGHLVRRLFGLSMRPYNVLIPIYTRTYKYVHNYGHLVRRPFGLSMRPYNVLVSACVYRYEYIYIYVYI